MSPTIQRRHVIQEVAAGTVGLWLTGMSSTARCAEPLFKISLAQWSLNDTIFRGKLDNLDFGNFQIRTDQSCDRYRGVRELMPFAKAVSAKSHDFDQDGNDTNTDFLKMMKIVVEAGYRGYVGIEYEGKRLSEPEGILATKRLLERVREQLA